MPIDEGTLYPLLRRRESQGLLTSMWREGDKRKKRFYLLSDEGSRILDHLFKEWRSIDAAVRAIFGGRNPWNC